MLIARPSIVGRCVSVCALGSNPSQHRSIKSKANRAPEHPERPPPWPYREIGYRVMKTMQEFTRKRLDENSKLIVVEGNTGSGKGKIAKELAEMLGFHYIPHFTPDFYLINRYGQDLRDFYDQFPLSYRFPDFKMFYNDPTHVNTARFQWMMLIGRTEQYCNAVAHILNTGQGVVLDRSAHSDFVFANAMRLKGFVSREFFRYYHFFRKTILPELYLRPHLVVYIDIPVDQCLKNIRQRGITHENNGKVIDEEYLGAIEKSYDDFLKDARIHSKVWVYDQDRIAPGADIVVEDIEQAEFDFYEWHSDDEVLKTWLELNRQGVEWNDIRYKMTNKWHVINRFLCRNFTEVEELYTTPPDDEHYQAVMTHKVLGSPYAPGYIHEKGDSWKKILKGTRPLQWVNTPVEPWVEYGYMEWLYIAKQNYWKYMDWRQEEWDPRYLEKHH